MLTLYHSPQSRSTRFLWILEELGEPYEVKYVAIRRGDGTGAPDPANLHPEGKVPALMHDGTLVRESAAISLYLTDAFPGGTALGPKIGDAKRADYLFWTVNYVSDLEPIMVARMTGGGNNPMMQRAYEQTMTRFANALKAGDYLLGDRFSAADILWGSAVQWMRPQFPAEAVFDRYVDRLTSRPAFKRAASKDKA